MQISSSIRAAEATIEVRGRFDFSSHRVFRQAVKVAIADAAVRKLRIDLSAVTYVDSAALGMLLLSRENAAVLGKHIVLVQPAGVVRQVLDIANFQKLFAYQ